jgi:4-hydroxy-tetrahydrodipicolinate reductase
MAAVIGTTGLDDDQIDAVVAASSEVPVVFAPNMSVGVNVLLELVTRAAEMLGHDYDVEIVETHHRFKKDAPSGTALKLAERIAETLKRDPATDLVYGRQGKTGLRGHQEIGVHAVRAGDVVGEHVVTFATLGERLELTHRAHSRETFARGALRAARFVVGKPVGLYTMADVLGL